LLQLPSRLKDRIFYGWVVVGAFCIIGTTIWGIRYSFGIFFKSIESEFGLTRAVTSAVFSTQMVLGGLFAIIGGWAIDRYGPRIVLFLMGIFTGLGLLLTSQTSLPWQLFITYSLLLSLGVSAIYVVLMTTVSRWFDKRRGLALGIASSGAGLGQVIMAPLATFLISSFDWRMAYLFIGLIAWSIVLPLSRLLKRDPYEIGALPDGLTLEPVQIVSENNEIQSSDLSLLKAVRTRSFWLALFSFLLFATNLFLILTHLVPHITDIGFSPVEAATVLSLMGGAAIAGRVLLGIASDRIGRKLVAVICALFHVGALLWLIWANSLWTLYLFALVYGFAWGGIGPCMAALIGDTFGVGRLGAILGMLDAGFSVGAGIGPVIGGLIFDINHSYIMAFIFEMAAMVVVTLLIVLVRRETNRTQSMA
jgi:OFA family oxalate/formate antiporter-like MFS transporter